MADNKTKGNDYASIINQFKTRDQQGTPRQYSNPIDTGQSRAKSNPFNTGQESKFEFANRELSKYLGPVKPPQLSKARYRDVSLPKGEPRGYVAKKK